MKRLAPVPAYGAVALGLFWAHSAWGALLGFHAVMLSALWLDRRNLPPLSLLVKSRHYRWVIVSLLIGSLSGLGLYALWPWLGIAPDLSAQLGALGLTRATWPAFILYFTLVNPWIEEFFWRGYLGSASKWPANMDFVFIVKMIVKKKVLSLYLLVMRALCVLIVRRHILLMCDIYPIQPNP